MKFASVLLMSLALMLSPAFAKNTTIAPAKPEAPKCVSLDSVEKEVKAGVKVEQKLTGDVLKKFNSFIAKQAHSDVPDNDGLLILSKEGSEAWLGVSASHGCVDTVFPVNPESVKKLFKASQEDGSV